METQDVISAINSELDFYRKRLFGVHTSILIIQFALLTGKIKLLEDAGAGLVALIVAMYLALVVASLFANLSYRKRLYQLRYWRTALVEKEKFPEGIFPAPGDEYGYTPEKGIPLKQQFLSKSPSVLYFWMIVATSIVSIAAIVSPGGG